MKLTIADLQGAESIDLGTSEPYAIDQARIDLFADATDDHQWIHTDPERARSGPYGGTIAHGYLVLSLVPKLLFQLIELPDAGMIVNYGLDKLRFLHPVPSGSAVRLEAVIESGQARLGGALCRIRCAVRVGTAGEADAKGKRAVIAEQLLLILPEKPA